MSKENIPPQEKKKRYFIARLLGGFLLLVGLIISGIIFFNSFQVVNPHLQNTSNYAGSNVSSSAPDSSAKSGEGAPTGTAKYSFYEQLQKRSNEVQAEINHRLVAQDKRPPIKGRNYRVQVGAFREKAQAEKMQHRMILRKLPTIIIQSGDLHLVQVGPYASQDKAEEVKKQLEADNIETVMKTFVNQ